MNKFYKAVAGILVAILILQGSGHVAYAQEIITVKQGSTETPVLVLPFSYSADTTLTDKGDIKVTHLKGHADFKSQLYNAALKTVEAGGNVLMIGGMQDHKQKVKYKIWGTAFYSKSYEQLKAKVFARKQEKLENGKYGYVVVYRPDYRSGFNDELDMELMVNDTMKLDMKANTKYLIRLSADCDVKIATRKDLLVQHIHAQPGNIYYVRAYKNIPGTTKLIKSGEGKVEASKHLPYFEIIDNAQGGLESSLVTLITVSKKL